MPCDAVRHHRHAKDRVNIEMMVPPVISILVEDQVGNGSYEDINLPLEVLRAALPGTMSVR
jgi:hypothetical protein